MEIEDRCYKESDCDLFWLMALVFFYSKDLILKLLSISLLTYTISELRNNVLFKHLARLISLR